MPDTERGRCEGKTVKGRPCRRRALTGASARYCRTHEPTTLTELELNERAADQLAREARAAIAAGVEGGDELLARALKLQGRVESQKALARLNDLTRDAP